MVLMNASRSIWITTPQGLTFHSSNHSYGVTDTGSTSLGWKILVGVILSFIVIGSLLGNVLVILAVLTNKKLRRVTYFFVVSLAVADLLVALLVMPLTIVVEMTGKWHFGTVVCMFWTSMDVMLCTASILNLCCISLDRYFAITRPLEYSTKRTKRLAFIMVGIAWFASVLITCPPLFGWHETGKWRNENECSLSVDTGYRIYSALGSFFVPLLVMTFVYISIFIVTRRSRRDFRLGKSIPMKFKLQEKSQPSQMTENHVINEDSSDLCSSYNISSPRLKEGESGSQVFFGNSSRNAQKTETALDSLKCKRSSSEKRQSLDRWESSVRTESKRSEVGLLYKIRKEAGSKERRKSMRSSFNKERKTAKTLSIVVGCFIVSWLPFFLTYIITPLCPHCYIEPVLWSFVTWLGYFNSFCNPLIYAFYSKDFRKSFWILTLGRCTRSTDNK